VAGFVAAMGGRLWIDDIPDHVGVHFTVYVGVQDLPRFGNANARDEAGSALSVIALSDSLEDRRSLVSTLGASGIAPIALTYPYATPQPLLAPGGTGVAPLAAVIHVSDSPFEVCEAFIRDSGNRIPVTMVVSSGRRGDAERCRALGVDGYLTMPNAYADLAEAVKATVWFANSGGPPTLITRHWLREGRPSLQVLVADDSAVNQRLVSNVLERRGHAITAVDSSANAVEAVQNGSFDVVVMDIQMPVMDGLEAIIRIRSSERNARTPIVALTASAEQADRARCTAAGVDHYLAKPWQPEELAAIVEGAATLKRHLGSSTSKATT